MTWSLSLEEQFYALAPVIFLGLFKKLQAQHIAIVLGLGILAVNFHRFSDERGL